MSSTRRRMIRRASWAHPEAPLLFVALCVPALLAFAPTNLSGAEPTRVIRAHPSEQARLARRPAWEEFTGREGLGWVARFDEATGTAHRAWGPGIDMGRLDTPADAEAAVRDLLARNPGLTGVPAAELVLSKANYVARTDTWYVDFQRVVGGVPLWRAGVTARIRFGKLVLLGIDTYPGVKAGAHATLRSVDAIGVARKAGPAVGARHTDPTATKVLLPMEDGVHLAWEVRSRTVDPPGRWVTFVDAASGAVLSWHNEVRFLEGTLTGVHDTRTVDGDFSTSPVRLAHLTGNASGSVVTTGDDGTFSIDAALETWNGSLNGTWLTVANQSGANGTLTVSGASPEWTDAAATQAEIDSWVFLHQVRDWSLLIAPEVEIATDALRSNVNLDSSCNAYYDGSVNFYQEGGGCSNTGRIADVNYHEWGHGFHAYSLQAGTLDGTMGEGIGDVVAMLQTLDPVIAPYFETDGSGIRELETDYAYPEDVIGEVHQDGLIFGGAMWDLLGLLAETTGESIGVKGQAWTIASTLFADAIKGGPTLETVYDEFLVADDDDGDLSNGTPHLCELLEAFGQHGLGPGGAADLLSLGHEAVDNQPAETPIELSGGVDNLAPDCMDFEIASVDVVYSVDAGATWESVPLDVSGDDFEGAMPGLPDGTIVQYYLVARDDDDTEVLQPVGGPIAPNTFYVGELVELYCEDFTEDDGDYTHALIDGRDERGADDWVWAVPAGASQDPTLAWSGDRVWGNDMGGDRYNGEYQPGITNRLTSVPVDIAGSRAVIVQYRRWLNIEDGYYDRARVYANESEIWSNHASGRNQGDEHTQDRSWVLHTLSAAVDGDTMTIGWELESDEGLEFGGWNIDDVCVFAPSGPLAWFVIDDFVASDDLASEVELSWTQPDDARATEAVVVRRTDRYPASKDDGDVAYAGAALTPGAPMSVADVYAGEAFYAVFAGGDAGWLTGATEGRNADRGASAKDNMGELDPGVVKLGGAGCGCASTGLAAGRGAGTGLALLALGAFLHTRRRRA